jgi:flotillin
MSELLSLAIPIAAGAIVIGAVVLVMTFLRVVVSTNDVIIVQSSKKTVSYGKGLPAGNTFYQWPAWVPAIGVQTTRLPVSVFSLSLKDYPGYDQGRVPFLIDIIGFFRITDPNMAAERLASFEDLKSQLTGILQGAIRSILASSEIEAILQGRAQFGEMFTHAVDEQLKQWGVQSVKTIELMDIRDANDSKVIANIMMKKKSLIESQSRIEVALNMQNAQTKEIEAQRVVEVSKQDALQQVGLRTAEKEQMVGVANEQVKQTIKVQEAITAERDKGVVQVNHVREAEIEKQVRVVEAEQGKAVAVIQAEGEKQMMVTRAEGTLAQAKLDAEGVLARGTSQAEAQRLMLMAPVATQIELAKEIGQNAGYQTYLVSIKQIDANQVVGVEQAKALQAAEIKVIANTGNAVDGVRSAMELFTPKGGTQIGAAIEAFRNTDAGRAVLDKLTTNGRAG